MHIRDRESCDKQALINSDLARGPATAPARLAAQPAASDIGSFSLSKRAASSSSLSARARSSRSALCPPVVWTPATRRYSAAKCRRSSALFMCCRSPCFCCKFSATNMPCRRITSVCCFRYSPADSRSDQRRSAPAARRCRAPVRRCPGGPAEGYGRAERLAGGGLAAADHGAVTAAALGAAGGGDADAVSLGEQSRYRSHMSVGQRPINRGESSYER